MAKIIFTQENGIPTIRVEGVKGNKCLDLTKDLEEQLGQTDAKLTTPEFFEERENKIYETNN